MFYPKIDYFMGYKKIIVTGVQSQKIHRLLKADKGNTPVQDLIDAIVSEAQVEEWVAERFAKAWRWNHRDTDNNVDQPTEHEAAKATYYVVAELPRKTNLSNPADGTGKVAQIIALAEQGKSTSEIIEMGFNKSTVYRQVSEWRKRKKDAKAQTQKVA